MSTSNAINTEYNKPCYIIESIFHSYNAHFLLNDQTETMLFYLHFYNLLYCAYFHLKLVLYCTGDIKCFFTQC